MTPSQTRLLMETEVTGGQFYTPLPSDETHVITLPPHSLTPMFCRKYQQDQLVAIQGSCVVIMLIQGHYQYTLIQAHPRLVLTIPSKVPNFFTNADSKPCVLVNAPLIDRTRKGRLIKHPLDYRPRRLPMQPNWTYVRELQIRHE